MFKQFLSIILVCTAPYNTSSSPTDISRGNKINAEDELQRVTCYDGKSQTGESLDLVTGAIADLGWGYNFDDKISSCCFQGIWLLYEDAAYNIDNHAHGVFVGWGDNVCMDIDDSMENKASSIKYSGLPDSYKRDSLNIYDGENYTGYEWHISEDTADFTKGPRTKSLILTGCDPWTIYTEKDYGGKAMCINPSDADNCYPTFIANPQELADFAENILSARIGCFA